MKQKDLTDDQADQLISLLVQYHREHGTKHPRDIDWRRRKHWTAEQVLEECVGRELAAKVVGRSPRSSREVH
jgi:hypothetical protein